LILGSSRPCGLPSGFPMASTYMLPFGSCDAAPPSAEGLLPEAEAPWEDRNRFAMAEMSVEGKSKSGSTPAAACALKGSLVEDEETAWPARS
jgi:hypothetical protein